MAFTGHTHLLFVQNCTGIHYFYISCGCTDLNSWWFKAKRHGKSLRFIYDEKRPIFGCLVLKIRLILQEKTICRLFSILMYF